MNRGLNILDTTEERINEIKDRYKEVTEHGVFRNKEMENIKGRLIDT